MTTVAWVTHHVPREIAGRWALPGAVGGAEMTDAAMIDRRPPGVAIDIVTPDQWERAMDADRVIVTGTDHLSGEAMTRLAERAPLAWVHHAQVRTTERAHLLAAATPLVCMSSMHAALEASWTGAQPLVCHGWIDLDEVPVGTEQRPDAALWAARNHPQKGRIGARIWASKQGVPLTEITDAPRTDVLDAMSRHRWFVFLPKGVDACPRTLIEAEAAGCEIVTNNLAGRREEGDLREVMAAQPDRFWGWL